MKRIYKPFIKKHPRLLHVNFLLQNCYTYTYFVLYLKIYIFLKENLLLTPPNPIDVEAT